MTRAVLYRKCGLVSAGAMILRLPKAVLGIGYEFARHLLRRPVVGICAAARTSDGLWLLVRRADTGTWAFPGGTLEWGETLRASLPREISEEAGVDDVRLGRVLGVFSRPDRDLRFHAVTVLVACEVDGPVRGPKNPLEIREARLFEAADIPRPLAMGMDDMLDVALASGPTVLE